MDPNGAGYANMNTEVRRALDDLQVPIRSFRLYGLEILIRQGEGPEVAAALEKRLREEDDAECRQMVEYAMAAVAARSQPASTLPPETPEAFAAAFANMGPAEKVLALTALSRDHVRQCANLAPQWLEQETNPLVVATLLQTFRSVWPKERAADVNRVMKASSLSVRLAALEILVRLAPDKLQPQLPKLLIHKDPRIRALGVHGLAAIDVDEAVAHVAYMLGDENRETRLAAVRCSVFLPFAAMRPHLLQALAENDDRVVLEYLRLLLVNNPDPEVPYRLFDIEQHCRIPTKRELVGTIAGEVVKNLQTSGLLGSAFATYRSQFAAWCTSRRPFLKAQELLQRSFADQISPEEIPEFFSQWDMTSELLGALRGQLAGIQDPYFRKALTSWLKIQSAQEVREKTVAGPVVPPPERREEKESSPRETVLAALQAAPVDVRDEEKIRAVLVALRKARREKLDDLRESVKPLLKAADERLVLSALAYLEEFAFDELIPFLGNFLRHPQLRVRTGALRLLCRHDSKQALSSLQAMFRQAQPGSIDAALACTVYFEFSQVRDLLLTCVIQPPEELDVGKIIHLFSINPSQDNLYALFRMEKSFLENADTEHATQAQTCRREMAQFLSEHSLLTKEGMSALEQELDKRWTQEQESQKTTKPYQVKVLHPGKDRDEPFWRQFLRQMTGGHGIGEVIGFPFRVIGQALMEFPKTTIGFFVLCVGVVYLLLRPPAPTPSTLAPQAVLAKMEKVQAKVVRSEPGEISVVTEEGAKYLLVPPHGKRLARVTTGSVVRVQVVPFRTQSDGTLFGECRSIQLVIGRFAR